MPTEKHAVENLRFPKRTGIEAPVDHPVPLKGIHVLRQVLFQQRHILPQVPYRCEQSQMLQILKIVIQRRTVIPGLRCHLPDGKPPGTLLSQQPLRRLNEKHHNTFLFYA